MYVTMDRYGADWNIVHRGYDAMVHGHLSPALVAECNSHGWSGKFHSAKEAVETARQVFPKKTDQDYPPFVIVDAQTGGPVGRVLPGDVVVNMNFRGDRAIEISRAFEDSDERFPEFSRNGLLETTGQSEGLQPHSEVSYYGMLIYDSDQGIPRRSLCPNPVIKNTLTELLLAHDVRQYAVSETHKFGHVTYFWNGNRSGYVDASKELYEEVRSDSNAEIVEKPEMKAREIKDKLLGAIESGKFKFIRANFANGDMVGHTGLIPETTQAVRVLDEVVGALAEKVKLHNGTLIITADHGNCEEKLDAKGNMKTSHTLNKVPFIVVGAAQHKWHVQPRQDDEVIGLANVAATIADLLDVPVNPNWGWKTGLLKPVAHLSS